MVSPSIQVIADELGISTVGKPNIVVEYECLEAIRHMKGLLEESKYSDPEEV